MNRLIAIVLLLLAVPAFAQTNVGAGKVSQVTMEVSQEVYSPFCPGKTLAMCPSPAAAEVRREIQTMAQDGVGKEQIKQSIIAQYGEEFRLEEPPLTDNLALLALIALGLALAGTAVWFISRRGSGREEEPLAAATGVGAKTDSDDTEDPYLNELRQQYRD